MQSIGLRECTTDVARWMGATSAIIAARGNNSRFDSRRGNDGGARLAVLRHAAWRFWRGRDQGGAAGNRRPVPRLGPALWGKRVRLLSCGEIHHAIYYSQ